MTAPDARVLADAEAEIKRLRAALAEARGELRDAAEACIAPLRRAAQARTP